MSHPEHKDYAGAKLGMWLFLFTEILLFGGLFLLYAVYLDRYSHEFAAGGRELNVVFGTANTTVLLTSSLLAAMAVTAIQKGNRRLVLRLLFGTVICAAIFMGIKYVEWSAKIHHGIYPGSQKLASSHGLHVLIGGSVLVCIAAKVKSGAVHSGDYVLLENGALYWHLVDLIWIFIFPLYYLIL